MLRQQAEYFLDRIVPELSRHGIHLRTWDELTESQRRQAGEYFDTQVSPALTPLVIQPTQAFPFFSNLSLSLAFRLRDDRRGDTVDARVKVPATLAQWVPLSADVPEGERLFVRLHEVIREDAHKLYPGMHLSSPTLFRLTRDAEVALTELTDLGPDEIVREQIRLRRYDPAVRLEFGPNAEDRLRRLLQERFGLADAEVYDLAGELDYTSLFQIAALNVPELRDPPFTPVTPARLAAKTDLFAAIQAGDLLASTPTRASMTSSSGRA